MNKIRWCAIGDSFTYLNDHLDETCYADALELELSDRQRIVM